MNLDNLKSLNPLALGKQLQQARQRRGLTQEEAARHIEVARTTIVAIEKGERQIRPNELVKLASAYGVSVSELIQDRPAVESFDVQFRRLLDRTEADAPSIQPSIRQLQELCGDYVELERLMKSPMPRQYPPEYKVEGLPIGATAERVATEERRRLGLGDGPIGSIRDIFENEVGIRVFFIPIRPSHYSEFYHYDDMLGACMAVNSLHPKPRRRWSLSHAYGHFLAHRHKPTIGAIDQFVRKPEAERFADDFALFFLLPTSGVLRHVSEIKAASNGFNVGDLFSMAHYYGVSAHSLSLRLEELDVLPNGTWDRLKNKGLKVQKIEEELGITNDRSVPNTFPRRYLQLAIEAYDQGTITEGQFAHFLRTDRLHARAIAEELRAHSSGATDPDLGQMNLLRK